MNGAGRGGRRRGATGEMGEERHERVGPDRTPGGGLWGGTSTDCVWRAQEWAALYSRQRRVRQEGDHPAQELPRSFPGQWQLLPLAGGVGRRVPVTTSPRLELELSPDLLRGQRGRGSGEPRGRRGAAPADGPTAAPSPPLLRALSCRQQGAPRGRGYLELRRLWRSFCSCSRRRLSSFTGLGMKPTSQPSFTSRPIHQSLLYFCR